MPLPAQPPGYHNLHLLGEGASEAALIVAPPQCFFPSERKYWGVAAQLYAVRSERDWGMGDFGDLSRLSAWVAGQGASFVGVNPLHALFLDTPEDASPYSPSSRLFLNPLYLDVTSVPDFAECGAARDMLRGPGVAGALRTVRGAELVDYTLVSRTKLSVLEALYKHFRKNHLPFGDTRAKSFRDYCARAGRALDDFAVFQALSEMLGTHDWRRWPDAFRDPRGEDTARFAAAQDERLSFFRYLQWQSDAQLGAAARIGREKGLALGLYKDLAVSVGAASADHWANRTAFLSDLRIGAPPDPFNEKGQEWGVVPLNPFALKAQAYAHFRALLAANMRHAGVLRVDHVMGWQRLFVIPEGSPATEGVYLRYPLEDFLAIAALESRRNECALVGEDLGTVPEGFRERMASANVLSCRVFYFEQDGGRFRDPGEFPRQATVSVATHDLATLRGYWTADDIAIKARLGIFRSVDEETRAREDRARDKRLLLEALARAGLLPEGIDRAADVAWSQAISDALHVYLARTPSVLLALQLDDILGEQVQVNLPGTSSEYPNWRRRHSVTLEAMENDPALATSLAAVAKARL